MQTKLMLAVVLFSLWNDNHRVRTLNESPELEATREDLRDALSTWLNRQQYRLVNSEDRYPLYIVNAEGGGIRAAYWTATVLGKIQKDNPCFADQLFALSGVSGGSLGSAVFVALLGEHVATGFVGQLLGRLVDDFGALVLAHLDEVVERQDIGAGDRRFHHISP